MKQFVLVIFVFGTSFAGTPPPPECLAGPPTGKTPQDCCKIPDLIPAELFSKCETLNPRPSSAIGSPPKGCCMSECVMNETGIMQAGKLDKAAALKYLSGRMAGDSEAIKAITGAVDFCEKETNNKKSDFDEMAKLPVLPAGEKVCSMISGFMIGCVQGQVYKNCPKDKYVADATCDGIKAFVEKCGFLFPIKVKV